MARLRSVIFHAVIAAGVGGCLVDVSLGKRLPADAGVAGNGGEAGFDAGPGCESPNADEDQDGFTIEEGDCDDCDPNSNPNAVEVLTREGNRPGDENCDGQVDEVEPSCDGGIALDDEDALNAVRALDLCRVAPDDDSWGVVSAEWVRPDGSPPPAAMLAEFHLGHGMFDSFGTVDPETGARALAISSGYARRPTDPDYLDHQIDKGYTSGHPQGFPKEEPSCPSVTSGTPHDGMALELVIRTPSNVRGIAFVFAFYTYEWPHFVCSPYNDFFVALLSPAPPDSDEGSVSFDSMGNTVSVNSAFLNVCGCPENPPDPCPAPPPPFSPVKFFPCPSGTTQLLGTGFGVDTEFDFDHGATSWLRTQTAVPPNEEITLRLAVYDSEDGFYDSLALIDGFSWIANDTPTVTEPL